MPKNIEKNALFLIDGSYLLYRSYYALRPLQTSKGIPTQATYGFCRAIKKLIDDFDPKNVVLVWDSKGPTFRKEIYSEYKAKRQKPPSDLFVQKEDIMEFAKKIGLFQVSKTGYEADDLIASIVKDFKKKNIVIVGPDKDLYQLISDCVVVFDPFKDKILDYKTFEKDKGYPPEKVSFFYSLLGDVSDNIPGVKGIGKKSALEIVKKFDSLKDLYKNLDKVKKEKIRKLLEQGRDNAFLSFKLFSLKYFKLNLKEKDFEFDKNNIVNAIDFFQKLEFVTLLKEIQKKFGSIKTVEKEIGKEIQTTLFDQEIPTFDKKNYEKQKRKWKCYVVTSQKDLDELFKKLKNVKEFAFDTETSSLDVIDNDLVGFSFAFNKKESYYVPLVYIDHEEVLEKKYVLEKLKPIFENSKIKKILHNTKFDQLVMEKYDIDIKNVYFDTLIAANLLRKSDSEKIGLKSLSLRYFDEPMRAFKQVLGKKYKSFERVPLKDASEYAAHDSLQTFKLKSILQKDLNKDKDLKKIFEKVEMPLSQVLFRMERFGIYLDEKKLREVGKNIEKDLNKIEKKIISAIARERKRKATRINLNSPMQIEKFLFDELKLSVIKKSSKGRRSTDQEVLFELGKIHPIPGMILTYRELTKLKSTYIVPIIKKKSLRTGRIHTSFSQTMVSTGRLSSYRPNLQNIPASPGHGIKIRSAFIASKGKVFLSADYSQVELRVLAHMTKDKNLIDAFLHDKDIHSLSASQIFEIPLKKVTNEQRQVGKRINFSIAYGLTPYGLSKDLGIKPGQAKDYIEKYFQKYIGVKKFIEKTVEFAKKNGFVKTWLGRRRYVSQIHEKNKTLFEAAKRIAINTPIQGTSAEIMKLAMIDIDKDIQKKKLEAMMVLQIHDELVFELPNDELKVVEKLVIKCMEGVVSWEIPFKVTIRTGKNWESITK
ncbi:DNA polymerase I [Candidatus Babeliales bacterium]|nr:DNA polymerase I [Candidatus Babeliales bacterium]